MVPPIGMLIPLANVFLVMGTELVTILSTEMIFCPAFIVVVAIVLFRK